MIKLAMIRIDAPCESGLRRRSRRSWNRRRRIRIGRVQDLRDLRAVDRVVHGSEWDNFLMPFHLRTQYHRPNHRFQGHAGIHPKLSKISLPFGAKI
ncbi:MAG: hypothetical protein ABI600_11625 [Luteolibacter sp.]